MCIFSVHRKISAGCYKKVKEQKRSPQKEACKRHQDSSEKEKNKKYQHTSQLAGDVLGTSPKGHNVRDFQVTFRDRLGDQHKTW